MTNAIETSKREPAGPKPARVTRSKIERPMTGMTPMGTTQLLQRSLGNRAMTSLIRQQGHTGSLGLQRACACGGSCANCAAKKEDEKSLVQPKLTVGAANDVYEQEADQVADQIMRMPDVMAQTEEEEEEELLQPKIQRKSVQPDSGFDPGPDFQLSKGGGQVLSQSTRSFMEPRFGADFGHVRIHNDRAAQQSAAQIHAKAFTSGNHIWLGNGASEQDKGLMAHELTHVVQQTG